MKPNPIIVEAVYKAPLHNVWSAITQRDLMAKWYFDLKAFEAKPGFHFEFLAGDEKQKYLHICEVQEVLENRKLSYSWCYEGDPGYTLVSFELFPDKEGTKLVLTHSGTESFDPSNPALARENFVIGWAQIIGKDLKRFVEKPM